MSDAIRNYRPPKRTYYEGPSRAVGGLRWILLPLAIIAMGWLAWTTRDSYPVERVIPRDQSFHLQVSDLLSTRMDIARSAIWETGLVPENYAAIPEWLGNSYGYPDWILNNLISDACYVSGTDLMGFGDLLVVTRMSRIGTLLERCHGFMDGIEGEWAGGLKLRKITGMEFYYAVRGRTLVFSPSRDAIVRALTLRESDAIDSLETAGLDVSGDLRGRMVFSANDPLGRYFDRSDCHLAVGPTAISFSSRSALKADWRAPLDALGLTGSPGNLSVNRQGGLAVAGNFGAPLDEVWRALDEMSGKALAEFAAGWGALDQLSAPDREALTALLSGLSGNLGTAFALRTIGFDADGMAPMPVFDLSLEPAGAMGQAMADLVSPLAPGLLPEAGKPYTAGEDGVIRFPLGWGDVVEPSAYWEGPRLHAALHPSHIAELRAAPGEMVPAPGNGHIYLRIRPGELADSFREGALLYAGEGMLRGHSPDSLRQSLERAEAISGRVPEIGVMLAYVNGELAVDIQIQLSAPKGEGDMGDGG